MNYTDYLQKAGIKKEKIKGWYKDYKNLAKKIPSEYKFGQFAVIKK